MNLRNQSLILNSCVGPSLYYVLDYFEPPNPQHMDNFSNKDGPYYIILTLLQ